MAVITVCPIRPVVIPADCGLRREFMSERSTVDSSTLTSRDYAEYDALTMFYDVFHCRRTGSVVAVGPPPVNLEGEIARMTVTHQGDNAILRHVVDRFWNLCVVRISVPSTVRDRATSLDFRFPSFRSSVRVPLDKEPEESSPGHLALLTMQRNNQIRWITDWITWHVVLHGVTRIVLYDNASDEVEKLRAALSALPLGVEILLVHWPFPYGPGRSDKNRFSKLGSQNHYRLRFGGEDAWCLVLDVDEYLVVREGARLRADLLDRMPPSVAAVLVDSYVVPPCPGQPIPARRRAGLYTYRHAAPAGRALKYVFRPIRIEYNRSHVCYPKGGLSRALFPFPAVYNRLLRLIYGSVLKRLSASPVLAALLPRRLAVRFAAVREMRFHHFKGLNSNWRPNRDIGEEVEPFDANRHVEDLHFGLLAVEAGIWSSDRTGGSALENRPGTGASR